MARDNTVNIVGNIVRDPELRYTPNGGLPVCSFSVAWNNRYERNGKTVEEVSYFDVVAWQSLAENVAATLHQGDRVSLTGRLGQRSWDTPEGQRRSKVEITAEEVSPSLRWATAEVKRTETRHGAPSRNGPEPRGEPVATPAGPAPNPNDPFAEF